MITASEKELSTSAALMVCEAQNLKIASNEDYLKVVDFCKEVKARQAKIVDYWRDAKDAANRAHKAICAKEKELLELYTNAEKFAKQAMASWDTAQSIERKRVEAELAKKQMELVQEQGAQADRLEAQSDFIGAQVLRSSAKQVGDSIGNILPAQKVSGVSYKEKWVAVVDDEFAVPSYRDGIRLRPVDVSALNRVGQLTNGTAKIAGVRFIKDKTVAVRK